MADAAKADEQQARGAAARSAARPAGRAQGSRRHGGHPHDVRLAVLSRTTSRRSDALIVTRIRAAGAITLGKTNTPEFGAGSQHVQPRLRRDAQSVQPREDVRRQQRRRGGGARDAGWFRSPTAATPADRCAIPRRSATSSASGRRRAACRTRTARGRRCRRAGPMARTVADVALFLSAIAGPHRRRSAVDRRGSARAFARRSAAIFKGVRVAWFKDLGGIPFEPEITRVVNANRQAFERARLRRRGRRAGFRRRGRGVPDPSASLVSLELRGAGAPASRRGQGHDEVGDRRGRAEHRGGRRPRVGASGADALSRHDAVLREVRVLRAAGDAGRAVRRDDGVSDVDRRRRRCRPTSTGCARAGT